MLWGGEFGRSPEAQGGKGRDHHNLGFTMWMAGGGIKGGQGSAPPTTIGLRAVEKPYHFRDIHTTILHQLGLDQDALSYPHLGRRERLTEVHGKVIEEILFITACILVRSFFRRKYKDRLCTVSSPLRHGFRLLLPHARRDCYSADRACTGNRRERCAVQRCRRGSVAADWAIFMIPTS